MDHQEQDHMLDSDHGLPLSTATIATRAANEGIPICAIARIVQQPFEVVHDSLKYALSHGTIGSMPKPDWPPTARWSERLPSIPRSANADDVEFQCKRLFKLTKLEATFMMVLLRYECADKEKLHGVIEQRRSLRPQRPDRQESTEVKMVDVIICKLRSKLRKADPKVVIETSWGHGYYFENSVKQYIFSLIGGPYACGPEAERADDCGAPADNDSHA